MQKLEEIIAATAAPELGVNQKIADADKTTDALAKKEEDAMLAQLEGSL